MARSRKLKLLLLTLPFAAIGTIAWLALPGDAPDAAISATPGASTGPDDFGDPLPAFAVRRFGSTRLRPGATNPVVLSPDGRTVYSGTHDGFVRVWDVESGRVTRTFAAHTDHVEPRPSTLKRAMNALTRNERRGPDRVEDVVVSPDGTRLATVTDTCVRVFDAATGERLGEARLLDDADNTKVLGFSTDGTRVLFGEQTWFAWSYADGGEPARIALPTSSNYWCLETDGATALFIEQTRGAEPPRAVLVDLATLGATDVPVPASGIVHGSPSPGGAALIAWAARREFLDPCRFFVTERATGRAVQVPTPEGLFHAWPRWLPDGSAIVVGTKNGEALVDPRTGAVRLTGKGYAQYTRSGRALAHFDGVPRVFDVATGVYVGAWSPVHAVQSFLWAPDSARLAVSFGDGHVAICSARDRALTTAVHAQGRWGPAAFDAAGKRLAITGWETDARSPRARVIAEDGSTESACDAAAGAPIAFQGEALVQVVQRSGALVERLDAAAAPVALESAPTFVNAYLVSADGRRLAGYPTGETLAVWDTATGRVVARLPEPGFAALTAISQDGRFVANVWGDVHVWSVDAPAAPVSIPQSETGGWSHALAVSPDGTLVATGDGWAGRVHVVSVAKRRRLATLEGHIGAIERVAFSPDGKLLASLGQDLTVVVWDVDAARAAAAADR